MNITLLLAASCPLAGLCNTELGKGVFIGAIAMGVLVVVISLISRLLTKKDSKIVNTKELDENKAKVAQLTKSLEEEKSKAMKSFEDGALYSLVLLQREGRFVDFIKEDIKNYDDSQIGAAVRQIHAGCSKVLVENFNIKALYDKNSEGDKISVGENFNAEEIRLSGNVPPKGPYQGILRHKGWASVSINMPKKTSKSSSMVVCPAEIEIE